MRLAITALVFLGGLFFVLLGLSFLFQPAASAPGFGLATMGTKGLATLRADLFAFFAALGACMIWGAWKRRGDLLLLPAIVIVLALIGRLVSGAVDGMGDGALASILMEAGIAIVLFVARAVLPHHRVQDVGD